MKKEHQQWLELVRIAKADGKLDEFEMRLVMRFASSYGISDSDIEALLAMEPNGGEELTSPELRVKYFYQALAVATIDFELSHEEIKTLQTLGEKFGFNSKQVEEVLEFAQKNGKPDLDPNALNQLFDKVK